MKIQIYDEDVCMLKQLGIDEFQTDRNYWFVRTQKGTYYEDFINEHFIGIEWDKISDKKIIEKSSDEEIKQQVIVNYPETDKPGYVASQILKFSNVMKRGDIVLIPSEGSKWISFGEILDDDMYILDEDTDDFQTILDDFYDQSIGDSEQSILKKRRRVNWIKHVKRVDLDPYLYGIIYSRNAIVDLNNYSLFIDRTLSQFYIKGEEAYFTFRVNKRKNIPYNDVLKFLNDNNEIINVINEYSTNIKISADNLILKINVQSRGPIQLKGSIKDVLFFGLIVISLAGTCNIDIPIAGKEIKIDRIPGLVESVSKFIKADEGSKKQDDLNKIKNSMDSNRSKLQLQLPNEEN